MSSMRNTFSGDVSDNELDEIMTDVEFKEWILGDLKKFLDRPSDANGQKFKLIDWLEGFRQSGWLEGLGLID